FRLPFRPDRPGPLAVGASVQEQLQRLRPVHHSRVGRGVPRGALGSTSTIWSARTRYWARQAWISSMAACRALASSILRPYQDAIAAAEVAASCALVLSLDFRNSCRTHVRL